MSGWSKSRTRTSSSEIASAQWVLRTAKVAHACQARSHNGAQDQAKAIAAGDQYARNTYFAKSYCIECFRTWAPSKTVRKLGLVPAIEEGMSPAVRTVLGLD